MLVVTHVVLLSKTCPSCLTELTIECIQATTYITSMHMHAMHTTDSQTHIVVYCVSLPLSVNGDLYDTVQYGGT